MPIYSFSTCFSNAFYLIWKIEESVAILRPQLPPQFLADFHSLNLSAKDRIRQSLAVRIALCYLLKQLGFPIFPLSKNAQGRPVLDGSTLHISFTHTHYLAAVALSAASPIGIDIEMVKPSLHRIEKKFLTEEETQGASHCLEELAVYWCAKEALYKRLDKQPIATLKDIFIEPFELHNEGKLVARLHQQKYTMGYQQVEDPVPHVLVWSVE